jgi:hypothetical protein
MCEVCGTALPAPRHEGRSVTLGDGRTYIVPPLTLRQSRALRAQLARLLDRRALWAEGKSPEEIDEQSTLDMLAVAAAALGRNYPELQLPGERAVQVGRMAAVALQDQHATVTRLAAGAAVTEAEAPVVQRMAELVAGSLAPVGEDRLLDLLDLRNLRDVIAGVLALSGYEEGATSGEAARRETASP